LAQVGVGCCCTSTAMAQQSSDLKFSVDGDGNGLVHALRDLTAKITRPDGSTVERTKKAGERVTAFTWGDFFRKHLRGLWTLETDAETVQINWNGSQWTGLDVKSKAVAQRQGARPEVLHPAPDPRSEQQTAGEEQMRAIHPGHWGITGMQLKELANQVVQKFIGDRENPNVYQVVDEIIKPACLARHVSYAVLLNPDGKECSTFATHAWFESFLQFVRDVEQYFLDFETRVFWICFAANPQTWAAERLQVLLGFTAMQSPFAIAMEKCKSVLVVRNTTRNMYSRLWCVTELALADAYAKKPVHVIGEVPLRAAASGHGIGLNADCSGPEKSMLLATIAKTGVDVDELVAKVIQARSGSVFRPSDGSCFCQ